MSVPINRTRLTLDSSQYFPVRVAKQAICLHFTAGGTAEGAVNWWRNEPEKVGTAFVVDLDGTVYQAFDPDCWAWHLGIGSQPEDSTTIGVEIVNWGPLKRTSSGQMLTWAGKLYTGAWKAAAYRGSTHWAAYPKEQMLAVGELVRDLCGKYSIPHKIPPVEWRDKYALTEARNWRGIVSHQNYRKDKTDVGPAFEWEYVAA